MNLADLGVKNLETLRLKLEQAASKIKLESYRPYPKQALFHALGATYRERALVAANQVGKTLSASREVAMHLTGRYPKGWIGKRFDRPVRWLAGSESAELTRKGVQRLLLGPPEVEAEWGTGAIPQKDIVSWSRKQGVPNAVDNIVVRSLFGGDSVIQLNSYDQGRTKWQADTVDGVWFDEEPPEDIYIEGLTRTNTTLGPVILTLTPLLGMSTVVMRFCPRPKFESCAVVVMTLDDAEHYTDAERAGIIATYPEHERDARTKGIPALGSGRIFPVEEERIKVKGFEIPDHWPRIVGLDFGFTHPTAASWLAWDRDTDTIYVYDIYRASGGLVPLHAAAIKARGAWMPVAWPHDGLNETAAGPQLAKQYREQGVRMRGENAKFPEDPKNPDRSRISVEAGLSEMLTRMEAGRWKVFAHCDDWFEEFRMYHRRDGKVVKEHDDLLSSSRIALMDLRFAKVREVQSRFMPHAPMLDPEIGY